jgi:hypothetical protein
MEVAVKVELIRNIQEAYNTADGSPMQAGIGILTKATYYNPIRLTLRDQWMLVHTIANLYCEQNDRKSYYLVCF